MNDELAKKLFDDMPHNNPKPGTEEKRVPDWNLQPESIKQVFRKKAEQSNNGN